MFKVFVDKCLKYIFYSPREKFGNSNFDLNLYYFPFRLWSSLILVRDQDLEQLDACRSENSKLQEDLNSGQLFVVIRFSIIVLR